VRANRVPAGAGGAGVIASGSHQRWQTCPHASLLGIRELRRVPRPASQSGVAIDNAPDMVCRRRSAASGLVASVAILI